MDAVDGWNAHAVGRRYDAIAPLAWRRGWRWRQAEAFAARGLEL
jgi:hypothetical protein